MNAVNLIPVERRSVRVSGMPGVPFLGLIGALVLALAATFVYVGARDRVAGQQSELAHVRAGVAEWSAAASNYAPAVSAFARREKQFKNLGGLLGERYEWSSLLSQLAGVMPADAQLSTLSATAGSPAGASATGGATGSEIDVAGCALSQPVVADTMIALRRLSGVSAVNLSSSARQNTGSGGGASGGSSGSGTCNLPVQFTLTLNFTPVASSAEMPVGATDATAGTAQGSTTPTATTSSRSTGAAQ